MRDKGTGPEPETRRALVAAAWALTEADGFDALSVNAVLRRAGLSKGTFYHWFESKTALVEAMLDQVLAEVSERLAIDLAAPGPADAISRLVRIMASFQRWRLANREKTMMSHLLLADPRNADLRRALRERGDRIVVPVLVETLRMGMHEGTIPPGDPDLLAELTLGFWHLIEDLQMADLNTGDEPDMQRLVTRAGLGLDWFERGLGLAPGALRALGDDLDDALASFVKE